MTHFFKLATQFASTTNQSVLLWVPPGEYIDQYMIAKQPAQCLPSAASSTAEDPLGVDGDWQTQQGFATFASWLTGLEAERALVQPVIPGIGGESPSDDETFCPDIPASQPRSSTESEPHPAALPLPPVPSSGPECFICNGKSNCIKPNI